MSTITASPPRPSPFAPLQKFAYQMFVAELTPAQKRLGALRRFAAALTIFNILGHTVLGFEQAYFHPIVAMIVAYSMELGLETMDATLHHRPLAYMGNGVKGFIDFLLPSHITALATAMLIYSNETFWPVALAVAMAVGSKHFFRLKIGPGKRHFMNPSNFGISITFLLFGWIGTSPPYQFSENLTHWWSWLIPPIILLTGGFLNFRLTGRIPVTMAWVGGFALQAVIRGIFFNAELPAALLPMSGLVFVLYTFYMVTDPATTPMNWKRQVLFGLSVAGIYGTLVAFHVVYGFFFALFITCALRGLGIYGWQVAHRTFLKPAVDAQHAERNGHPASVPDHTLVLHKAEEKTEVGLKS
jgi:hypothetical protein